MGCFKDYIENRRAAKDAGRKILEKKRLVRDELKSLIYPALDRAITSAINNVVKYVIVHFDQTDNSVTSFTELERTPMDIDLNRKPYLIKLQNRCFDDDQVLYDIIFDYEDKGFECIVATHDTHLREYDKADDRPIHFVQIDCSKSIRGRG